MSDESATKTALINAVLDWRTRCRELSQCAAGLVAYNVELAEIKDSLECKIKLLQEG